MAWYGMVNVDLYSANDVNRNITLCLFPVWGTFILFVHRIVIT